MRLTRSRLPASIWLLGLTMVSGCEADDSSPGGASGSSSGGTAAGSGGVMTGSSGGGGAAGAGAGTAGSGAGASAVGGQSAAGGASGAGGSGQTGGSGQAGGTSPTGGSPPTGGSGGAAGTSGAGLPCAGKTYKLCEDFEGGSETALPAGWTSFKGYGTASAQDQTVTSAEFHSGAKALQSTSAQKGISRIQKDLAALGATASKHWGRIFYKVKSPAAKNPSNVLHVTFVSLMGTTENRVVDIVEQQNSNVHQWLFNNPNDQGGKASSYDWTFDSAWHCAQWFVDVGAKSYRFFSDAEEVEQLAFSGQDNQMSDYKSLIVGATHYQSDTLSEPFVVWFDDLAIDDTQVGCQ
jgi:hypothetical protein